jgi:hypothetical protein
MCHITFDVPFDVCKSIVFGSSTKTELNHETNVHTSMRSAMTYFSIENRGKILCWRQINIFKKRINIRWLVIKTTDD